MKRLCHGTYDGEWICEKCGFKFNVLHNDVPVFGLELNYCPQCGIAFNRWKRRNKSKPSDGGEEG